MQLRPLFDRIMYEVVAADAKTEAGIFLPNSMMDDNNNPVLARVLDIGPDVKKVEIGETVLISRHVSNRYVEGFGDKQVIRFYVEEKHVIAHGR